jgi:hypothetical protein
MPAFFSLLKDEKNPAVKAVLGHFFFVYIHPYVDGNGRMGRFLMNVMLVSGGYQSGFLDVKLIINESENFIGEVITELPPIFVLKKGSKIKLKKRDLLYKPNYK